MTQPAEILPALAPDGGSSFPYPGLTQNGIPGVTSVTCEGPTINGVPMPGQWLLVRAPRIYGWQKQQPSFMSGGTLVPTGDPSADIEYRIKIWEAGAAAAFNTLLGTLLKKPAIVLPGNLASAALGINDPALKSVGITTVVVAEVSPLLNPLVESGGKGAWTSTVKFYEWRKPIPAPPVPNQAIPDPNAVTPAAVNNLATANAAVSAGAAANDAATARALL